MVVENEIFELGAWLAEAQKRKWTVFYFPALGYWPGPEFNFQPRISCPHPLTQLSRFCVSAGSDWLALGAWPHVYQALVFCWQGFAKHIPSALALQRNSSGVHCNPGKLNSKLDQGTDWPVDTKYPSPSLLSILGLGLVRLQCKQMYHPQLQHILLVSPGLPSTCWPCPRFTKQLLHFLIGLPSACWPLPRFTKQLLLVSYVYPEHADPFPSFTKHLVTLTQHLMICHWFDHAPAVPFPCLPSTCWSFTKFTSLV